MLLKFEKDKGKADKPIEPPVTEPQVNKAANIKTHDETIVIPAKRSFAFFQRVKKIKNIEIYAAIALIAVMVIIYLTTLTPKPGTDVNKAQSGEDYAAALEQRLESTLSQIRGAGRVTAMVTLASSSTIEVAYNSDEKTVTQVGQNGTSNTTTTIVKTPIIVNGQPLVLYEIMPKVKGIVIVAGGASDIAVRLDLMRAVQTLLVDSDVRIDIFTGKN
jgi:stage III sporulation protein AG